VRLIFELSRFVGISAVGFFKCFKSIYWFIAAFLMICVCLYLFSIAQWMNFAIAICVVLVVFNIKGGCKE